MRLSAKFTDKKLMIALVIVVLSVLIYLSYYIYLFIPSRDTIKDHILKEFIAKSKTKAIIFENTLSQYIQGANSLSSRSMIRLKIIDFYDKKISVEQLKSYTLPKFKDGVEALEYFVYAR